MNVLGGIGRASEYWGGQALPGAVRRHAARPNVSQFLQDSAYYAAAVLVLATAVVWDQINTSRARDAVAKAEASKAAIVAEQLAAERSVVDDVKNGRTVLIAGGIVPSDEMCLLNPIVEDTWLVLIARTQQDDPDSLQAFVAGRLGSSHEGQNIQATTVSPEPGRGTYIVASPDSAYAGLPVGVGLPRSETKC